MSAVFEDVFARLQTDMIDVCLEYVNDMAEKVYIYVSCEDGSVACDFFYRVDGKMIKKHRLAQETGRSYDTSVARQKACMKVLQADVLKLISACKEFEREMPTEIKLIYSVSDGRTDADYSYDKYVSDSDTVTAFDRSDAWFRRLK